MSGPEGSEPTRPWSPPPDPQEPTQFAAAPQEKPAETPWWQEVRRRTPPTPSYPAEPQAPSYQPPSYQPPAYPPAPPPAQQAPQAQYYPQYAQQPAQPAAQPKQSKRGLLIAGAALVGALVAVAVVVGVFMFGGFASQVLNVSKAEADVKKIITDPTIGYGIKNVTDVKCNNGDNPAAKKGDTFTCDVTVDGKKHKVRAVFVDDNGTYEVDRPK